MVAGGPELEPLLGPEREHAVAHGDGSGGFPWLTVVGFAFLTSSSGMAISRSKGDMAAVAYVAFSYAGLVALFCCFRCYERARPGSLHREHLKSAVWMLTTLLTLLFSYKFASIAPVPVQILVCVIAGAFVFGGFYALFVVIDKSYDEESIPKEMGVIMLLTLRSVYYLLSPFALHIKDAIAAAFRNRRRVRTRAGGVLAALRRHWPRRADGNRAQDPSDIAWSVIRLIVDSGASRHAVGNTLLLEGVQFYSPLLSARLADGRNMRILGIGRIQRVGQFSIPNVDLVEGVQDGLISIPQLDREHGLIACFGNGECRIMHANGTVVGAALLEDDGMYVLRYLQVPAVGP